MNIAVDLAARKAYQRQYYLDHKEKLIKAANERNKNNPRRNQYYKAYRDRNKDNPEYKLRISRQGKARYHANPEKHRQYAKDQRIKLREEFILAYGNKCACCNEPEHAFLTLEHKNRNGSEERKMFSTSSQILASLRRKGWPKDDYELLCFNCNRASWERGICPHRQEKQL